jgi:transcriptional regulator with XRE-family HTH domain
MPIRQSSSPLVTRLGQRIRELRLEQKLPLEQLAYGAGLGGKGYLSETERGLALPSLVTLEKLADCLDIDLVDLVNFPELSSRRVRARLIEATRDAPDELLQVLLRAVEESRQMAARFSAVPLAAERPEPYHKRRSSSTKAKKAKSSSGSKAPRSASKRPRSGR